MENKLTPELIEKARQAKSPEELLSLAKENNMELTEEQARDYFARLNQSGEISDDELDNVAGGGCFTKSTECPKCHSNRWSGGVCFNCGYHNTLIM